MRLKWDWIDKEKNMFVIPGSTSGLKRVKDKNDQIPHHVPITSEMECVLDRLAKLNGTENYLFHPLRESKYEHLDPSAPNNYLKNLGYGKNGIRGKQDAHGFRHLATNTLVDEGGFDEKMVSRCLGHLHNDGAIGHYDFAERIQQRREIHEYWNQLLIKEGLRI